MAEEKQKLGRDVFIALAAIGWADGNLDENEADAIVRTASEEGLEIEEIAAIEEATKSPVEVGAIDISTMTKADRLFVYAVGTWISRVDGEVALDELKALQELAVALKIPDAPRRIASKIAAEVGKLEAGDEPSFFELPKLRRTLKKRLDEARELREAQVPAEGDDAS
jgi:uncharacterized membrane protein YebE (DUF533 family)